VGYGDDIMALGEAEHIARVAGGRVLIVDAGGAPRWSEVWEHHPAIARSEQEPHRVRLVNGPGARPYIKAWATSDGAPMTVYSDSWRAQDAMGSLVLSPEEVALGRELQAKIGPYVVVEPTIKANASPNKDWGLARYQEVVDRNRAITFVQMTHRGSQGPALQGVQHVATPSFRAACGVLARAAAYLGPEGGLHHASAALRVPAVIIFGSFCSPRTMGYPFHANLYVQDQHGPCGRWAPCAACRLALDRIRPEDVARFLASMLNSNHQITHRPGVCGHPH
jgi:hypothetical protein